MRTMLLLAWLSLLALSFPSRAEQATGRIRAVHDDAVRWAEVELEPHGRRVRVRLPTQLNPRVGDRVGVELVDPEVARLAELHRGEAPVVHASRVTEVHPPSMRTGAPGR